MKELNCKNSSFLCICSNWKHYYNHFLITRYQRRFSYDNTHSDEEFHSSYYTVQCTIYKRLSRLHSSGLESLPLNIWKSCTHLWYMWQRFIEFYSRNFIGFSATARKQCKQQSAYNAHCARHQCSCCCYSAVITVYFLERYDHSLTSRPLHKSIPSDEYYWVLLVSDYCTIYRLIKSL